MDKARLAESPGYLEKLALVVSAWPSLGRYSALATSAQVPAQGLRWCKSSALAAAYGAGFAAFVERHFDEGSEPRAAAGELGRALFDAGVALAKINAGTSLDARRSQLVRVQVLVAMLEDFVSSDLRAELLHRLARSARGAAAGRDLVAKVRAQLAGVDERCDELLIETLRRTNWRPFESVSVGKRSN